MKIISIKNVLLSVLNMKKDIVGNPRTFTLRYSHDPLQIMLGYSPRRLPAMV